MSSQLVVIDLTRCRNIDFSQISGETAEMLAIEHSSDMEVAILYQMSYNREYSDFPKIEVVVYWDDVPVEPRDIGYTPSDKEQFVLSLCKKYEEALNGNIVLVKHDGLVTRIEFKRNTSEPLPINLEWVNFNEE